SSPLRVCSICRVPGASRGDDSAYISCNQLLSLTLQGRTHETHTHTHTHTLSTPPRRHTRIHTLIHTRTHTDTTHAGQEKCFDVNATVLTPVTITTDQMTW